MKKIFIFFLVLTSMATYAQVGIGVSVTDMAPSAQLEVKSTNKGLLPPRMTQAQKNAISSPATGLLVYQTDSTKGYYYFNGATWGEVGASSTHAIGDSYGGGIVFYTWDNGAHGLIVAKNEIGANGPEAFTSTSGIKWGPTNLSVGSFRNGIGAGKGNTDIIISKTPNTNMQYFNYAQSTTDGYAAIFAAQYLPTIAAGEVQFGDWYLPSWSELYFLVTNAALISGSGYNSSHNYWSSTETNAAYAYRGGTSGFGWHLKSTLNYVLPIRQY
jgi:hypothetical protein